jgi:hypothetical protein
METENIPTARTSPAPPRGSRPCRRSGCDLIPQHPEHEQIGTGSSPARCRAELNRHVVHAARRHVTQMLTPLRQVLVVTTSTRHRREGQAFFSARKFQDVIFLFRPSMATDMERAECLNGARLVWSQWEGYLTDPRFAPFLEWQQRLGLPLERLHTSGHASIGDLQRLAEAISAKRVVPIHSFESGRYTEFFTNVECRNDGERWAL